MVVATPTTEINLSETKSFESIRGVFVFQPDILVHLNAREHFIGNWECHGNVFVCLFVIFSVAAV